jgi:hypothetical protein
VTATDLDPAALLEALHAALDLDPSDAATRQVLADILEDQGDPAGARGQRWQALYGRWPVRVHSTRPPWRLWRGLEDRRVRDDPDDLPGDVFELLAAGAEASTSGRYYPTRRAAEADLAQALEALARKEAASAGYDGEPCPWCGEREQVSSGRERACDGCGKRWES